MRSRWVTRAEYKTTRTAGQYRFVGGGEPRLSAARYRGFRRDA